MPGTWELLLGAVTVRAFWPGWAILGWALVEAFRPRRRAFALVLEQTGWMLTAALSLRFMADPGVWSYSCHAPPPPPQEFVRFGTALFIGPFLPAALLALPLLWRVRPGRRHARKLLPLFLGLLGVSLSAGMLLLALSGVLA